MGRRSQAKQRERRGIKKREVRRKITGRDQCFAKKAQVATASVCMCISKIMQSAILSPQQAHVHVSPDADRSHTPIANWDSARSTPDSTFSPPSSPPPSPSSYHEAVNNTLTLEESVRWSSSMENVCTPVEKRFSGTYDKEELPAVVVDKKCFIEIHILPESQWSGAVL